MTQQPAAPTRRTVLRAAAWTAPAVSIAVAAPAFATSPTQTRVTLGGLTIIRSGSVLKAVVAVTADQALSGVSAVVTLRYVGPTATRVTSTAVSSPWTTSGHADTSATFTAAALPKGTTPFDPRIDLDNTSFESVDVTVTFTWPGSGQGVTTSATYTKDKSVP